MRGAAKSHAILHSLIDFAKILLKVWRMDGTLMVLQLENGGGLLTFRRSIISWLVWAWSLFVEERTHVPPYFLANSIRSKILQSTEPKNNINVIMKYILYRDHAKGSGRLTYFCTIFFPSRTKIDFSYERDKHTPFFPNRFNLCTCRHWATGAGAQLKSNYPLPWKVNDRLYYVGCLGLHETCFVDGHGLFHPHPILKLIHNTIFRSEKRSI
jgi:hypothetical protein